MDILAIIKFENSTVVAMVKKEQVLKAEGEALFKKVCDNSLPEFFAAFLEGRKLTKEESARIKEIIEEATK